MDKKTAELLETRPKKSPSDSACESMKIVASMDINGFNRLFGGRLMEWIDELAGIAARRHCGGNVTTACVDSLQFKNPAFLNDIVVLQARVTYVGRTSLEVRVDSFEENPESGVRRLINTAYLTEVCLDENDSPRMVPYGLRLETEEERRENEAALFRREVREARKDSGL